jgi:hypothetical protein
MEHFHKPKSVCVGGGGMGIIDLDIQNKCLLSKWIIKLINEDVLWKQVLKKSTLRVKLYHKLREGKGTHISSPG